MNVPLLPIAVDVRVRRLPPPRFTLRRLMVAVAVAGLVTALFVWRNQSERAMNYHKERLAEEARSWVGPKPVPGPAARWHHDQVIASSNSYLRHDFSILVAFLAAVFLGVVAVLGRLLDLLLRRTPPNPNLNPEGARP